MSLAALNWAHQQQQHLDRQNHRNLQESNSYANNYQDMMTVPPEATNITPTYYASGSLPRINTKNMNRRVISRNSMSLTRSSSVRNSCTSALSRLTQVPPPVVLESRKISPESSIAPCDSVSVNNRHLVSYGYRNSVIADPDTKNKYNTLTPAEAKKLNRFITARPPIRTASVLHKPRPPPILVTNLDDLEVKYQAPQPPVALANGKTCSNCTRSASSCSNHSSCRDQRNSMNIDQQYNNRYAFSTSSNNNTCSSNRHPIQTSPDDSESNLSFRSSLDIVDSAYGSDRLQTMSVDLGQPNQQYMNSAGAVLPYNHIDTFDHSRQELSNKLSDESYCSAKSHQSETGKLKSLSKLSLSSSTSKTLHNHLYSLKKFFRHLPTRRSIINNTNSHESDDLHRSDKPSLAESVSQICLNRSQSPPVCPPPPGELKSMSYMENSSITYSNYDDFTRARNQQIILNNYARQGQQQANSECRNNETVTDTNDDAESWQLASLPVSYERNLATVFEEKQNSTDFSRKSDKNYISINNNNTIDRLIKPPARFDDRNCEDLVSDKQHSANGTSSSQSLTSITTTDSILDFHRQTATSFRFSYAQPKSFDQHVNSQTNSGLPPRMPINNETKQTNSCSSSSINSLPVNGQSNCDQQKVIVNKSACGNVTDYNIANILDNDNDTTILSDASTLNGDVNNLSYKCAELERTVGSLKNKLISKEKELTDLQLKQWSSDYLIDQLKSTIGRLEKENAQLKAVLDNTSRVNL